MGIVLASGSPRRKEILTEMGLCYRVSVTDADETSNEKDPCLLTEILAKRKAEACAKKTDADDLIIAADTVVSIDGKILGKPKDEDDARSMLETLSGRTHIVATGICLIKGGKTLVDHDSTEVVFRTLTENDIEEYIKTGEPFGKAGAYAIQGIAGRFVEKIVGSKSNVIGLSKEKLSEMLKMIGE